MKQLGQFPTWGSIAHLQFKCMIQFSQKKSIWRIISLKTKQGKENKKEKEDSLNRKSFMREVEKKGEY